MSVTTFRAGDKVAAARMNLALREAAAVSGAEAAAGTVEEQVGVPLERFGVVSGGGDNTTLLNTAIANAAGEGWRLITGHRRLRIEGQPIFVDGLSLDARGTTFERRFSSGVTSWVIQEDYDTAITIKVRGGRWWNPDPDAIQGNMIDLRCDDSELWDFFIDEWGDGGRALLFAGNRNLLGKIRAISAHDGGGLRMNGVEYTTIAFCRVKCGDDCFMFNTTTNPLARYADLHNRRSQYIGCEGDSWNARVAIVEAYSAGSGVVIASECTDLGFYGIKGKGRAAAFIGNNKSSGKLARITLSVFNVDCSPYAVSGTAGLYILAEGASGGVEDVTLDDVTVLSPYQENLRIKGTAKRVKVVGGCFTAPQTASSQTVLIEDGAEVRMTGTHVEGRSDYDPIMVMGSPAPRFFFEDGVVSNIGDGRDGIDIATLAAGGVSGTRFLPASGATTSRAITAASGVEGLVVGANDYSALTPAVKMVWPAAANTGCRVDTPATRTTAAAATLRAHESGLTLILTGSTGRTFTLPPAGGGMRFRLVQQGSGVLRVQAAADDVIQIGASTSTVTGYADASAAGDGVDLVAIDGTTWLAQAVAGTWTVST